MCYMRTITHRELRNNSGEILRRVAAGESFEITNNGHLAAVISPPKTGSVLDELIARGEARPATRPIEDLATIKRVPSDVSTAEIVADVRGPR